MSLFVRVCLAVLVLISIAPAIGRSDVVPWDNYFDDAADVDMAAVVASLAGAKVKVSAIPESNTVGDPPGYPISESHEADTATIEQLALDLKTESNFTDHGGLCVYPMVACQWSAGGRTYLASIGFWARAVIVRVVDEQGKGHVAMRWLSPKGCDAFLRFATQHFPKDDRFVGITRDRAAAATQPAEEEDRGILPVDMAKRWHAAKKFTAMRIGPEIHETDKPDPDVIKGGSLGQFRILERRDLDASVGKQLEEIVGDWRTFDGGGMMCFDPGVAFKATCDDGRSMTLLVCSGCGHLAPIFDGPAHETSHDMHGFSVSAEVKLAKLAAAAFPNDEEIADLLKTRDEKLERQKSGKHSPTTQP